VGKRELVDKAVKPGLIGLRGLQTYGLTIAQAQDAYAGVIPIGDFKGGAGIWDLDLAVKQPLVWAEQQHILGILDGRLEDYDLQTITIPAGALANAVQVASLTVPTGQVWFINAVAITLDADNVSTPAATWHCSLWTDPAATPSQYGQPFNAVAYNFTPAGGVNWDEFGVPATAWAATNKGVLLRAPAGTVFTFVVTNLGGVAGGAMVNTMQLYGSIGKPLVD